MKNSKQDDYYFKTEGNSFFKRKNFKDKKVPELRPTKQIIYDEIKQSKIKFNRVLEYGGNYGDLLNYLKKNENIDEAMCVDASNEALEFGKQNYGDLIKFSHGTIAHNQINDDPNFQNFFDLIIIDDVFGWVSRETLFQSISNIDNVLADGGFLFIRDFYPDKRIKNQNHHVHEGFVYNYKVPNSHASLFLTSGIYEIEWQKIFFDDIGMSTDYKSNEPFIYRWTDIILKKSYSENFFEIKPIKT
jgi:SAM-dependent methyltransferase